MAKNKTAETPVEETTAPETTEATAQAEVESLTAAIESANDSETESYGDIEPEADCKGCEDQCVGCDEISADEMINILLEDIEEMKEKLDSAIRLKALQIAVQVKCNDTNDEVLQAAAKFEAYIKGE